MPLSVGIDEAVPQVRAEESNLLLWLTCAGRSLWQPRRHRVSLERRLLWRQEVRVRESGRCHIGRGHQGVARVTELQWALIGCLDCDGHGE